MDNFTQVYQSQKQDHCAFRIKNHDNIQFLIHSSPSHDAIFHITYYSDLTIINLYINSVVKLNENVIVKTMH